MSEVNDESVAPCHLGLGSCVVELDLDSDEIVSESVLGIGI